MSTENDEARGAEDWITDFAARLDIDPPTREEMGAILKLAGTAAHASERTAAPMACWLAGKTSRSLDELNELAREI